MPPATRHGKRTPVDRISDLPRSLIENILMCLPTRDAARTSILSKKWRYKWTTIPQLILDDTIWDVSAESETLSKNKLIGILYKILSLHQGPIFKFGLSITALKSCPEIDNLIVLLSRSEVKDFTLKLCLGKHYKMPSSFFSCQELRELNLRSCLISPPIGFKGFSQLVRMKLHQVDVASIVLGSLISSCPLLENLELQMSENLNYLEINAPKLKSFIVKSQIKSLFFKNTPVLAMVSLVLDEPETDVKFPKGGRGITEHFGCLLSIENMHLHYYFIKSLSRGGIPTRLRVALIHLKVLKLTGIALDVVDEISFVLCLLRSSPNLQEIDFWLSWAEEVDQNSISEFLDTLDYSDVTLKELREVKLLHISGTRPEMELIKLFLEKSPTLEEMIIQPSKDENHEGKITENGILKELNSYQRASRKARVIYGDPIG